MTGNASENGSKLLPKISDPDKILPAIREQIPVIRAACTALDGYRDEQFSDNQLAFCALFVETCDSRYSSTASGFVAETGFSLSRSPKLIPIIKFLSLARLHSEGVALSVKALADVLRDPGAPAAARVTAAKLVKDWTEQGDKNSPVAQKALSEMSVGELAGLIDKLEDCAKLQANTILIPKDGQ